MSMLEAYNRFKRHQIIARHYHAASVERQEAEMWRGTFRARPMDGWILDERTSIEDIALWVAAGEPVDNRAKIG